MAEQEVAPAAGSSKGAKPRLSITSRRYDIDGDGKLDEAEQGMRDLDKSGRGYLTNEKVYGLMQDHMKTQKELFSMRRMMIALACFTVVLAISNLGTALAAAVLAKETRIANEALVDKKTGSKISTVSEAVGFGITVETDAGSRRTVSCRPDPNDPNYEICFETASGRDNNRIKHDDVVTLYDQCLAGHSVFLKSDTCGPDYICGTAQGPATVSRDSLVYTFDEARVTVTCSTNNGGNFYAWCDITGHTGCAAADNSALVCASGEICYTDNCEETMCCTVSNPPVITKACECDTVFNIFHSCVSQRPSCDADASTYIVGEDGNCAATVCASGEICNADDCEETMCCTVGNPPVITKACECDTVSNIFHSCVTQRPSCDADASTYIVGEDGNCALPADASSADCSDEAYWNESRSGETCLAAEEGLTCDYDKCQVCDEASTGTVVTPKSCSCENGLMGCMVHGQLPGCVNYDLPHAACDEA